MPIPAPVHQQIAGIVKRAGEGLKPLFHLLPVDVSLAQTLGKAPQLTGVLRGDDNAVRHHPDFYRHPVSKPSFGEPYTLQRHRPKAAIAQNKVDLSGLTEKERRTRGAGLQNTQEYKTAMESFGTAVMSSVRLCPQRQRQRQRQR